VTGDLVHPCTGRPAPAAVVVSALLEHIRPALSDAGDEQRVADGLAAILRRGTGADLQRHVHREAGGDLGAVVRAAVEVTTAQPGAAARAHTGSSD
jgi:carboxylate-amine ligase